MTAQASASTAVDRSFVVAISSRALFDLDESHRLFEREGVEAYSQFQIAHENDSLRPGIAFPLVKKLLHLNQLSRDVNQAHPDDPPTTPLVEVILLSRNSGDTGLRIFNSIENHGLDIVRAAFTNGASPFAYVESFGADLFLSTNPDDVREALNAGFAAATILPSTVAVSSDSELRIAFDGDAVLFHDAAERIYQEQGLEAFAASEKAAADRPLSGGPFKPVLSAIHRIQAAFPAEHNPIRTALVTARSAPAHKRVILTLRDWGIRLDEALFLGGKPKGPFLKAFGADIFFDDQTEHCDSASNHVATGHVPHGVANRS
ncbi:MAG: 5'-nucleotidase [Pseudomonadota bacterium]